MKILRHTVFAIPVSTVYAKWLTSVVLLCLAGCTALTPKSPDKGPLMPVPPAIAVEEDRAADPPQVMAVRRALNAIVGLHVTATEGATSSLSLGDERKGTGVIIDTDGLILTIGYLLLESQTIEVTMQDARTIPARPLAYDGATGFGLVQPLIPVSGVEPAPMGSVRGVAPGEAVMVGVAIDDEIAVGITRVIDKRPFSGYWEYHIETALFTAPPVPRHSGAAVFNRHGELLGIGSLFVMDATGRAEALPGNMFVPVDLLRPVLAEMRSTGSTRAGRRPWLGVSSLERAGHVQIIEVDRNGPARRAGVRVGDVVLAVDGTQVSTLEAFYKRLWARPDPGGEIELTVQQGKTVRKLRLHTIDRMKTLRRPEGI